MKANNKAREFLSLLQRIIRRQIVMRAVPMVVISVDKAKGTITAQQEDSPETFSIRLRASIDDNVLGVIIYPKVDSFVLVDYIMNDKENGFVTQCSEIESAIVSIGSSFKCELKPSGDLILNNGNNGALIKIQELQSKLNSINTNFQTLLTAAQAGLTATAGTAPADGAAGFTAFVSALASIQAVTSTGLNNDKIKH